MPSSAETITDHSLRQVRTFLYNLANRTHQHAQIDRVTRQIARQYQGRTVIELLQNAHDALRHGAPGGRGRIAFHLVTDGDHGALYVANDGRPLRDRDAVALAEIGLSSKDPATDVGNKGLGFRSVLHVTDRPAVYSCAREESGTLDGYGLTFSPDVLALVARALEAAVAGEPVALFGAADALSDWSADQRDALCRLGQHGADGWAAREVETISPYSLPVPATPSPTAEALAADGFSTVVHLPLVSARAAAHVRDELRDLAASDDLALFLESLRALTVSADDVSWTLTRTESPAAGPHHRRRVALALGDAERTFSVWSRPVGGAGDDAFQAAAADLPDDWSRVEAVSVDVAVEHTGAAPRGRYSIFLPTEQPTGTGAFINAPFYGDIDRRGVSFDYAYNALLRQAAVSLSADVALSLAGRDESAGHVLDLVAPATTPPGYVPRGVLAAIAERRGDAANVPLVRTAAGWASPRGVRVSTLDADQCPLGDGALDALAGFARPHPSLDGRRAQIIRLLEACGVDPDPTLGERAALVEAVAPQIGPDGDWDGFWEWARRLCGSLAPLRSRRVLLVEDGRLLPLIGDVKVFFPPQTGTASGMGVPDVLSSHVAFLAIPLRQQGVLNSPATRARRALADFESDLAYDPAALFRRVLVPALPKVPVALESPQGRLCAAVLRWATRLYADRTDWEALGALPVPCRGGWYRADRTMLGPGWTSLGDDLDTFLSAVDTPLTRRLLGRLVVPPDHPAWEGADAGGDLRRLGVAEGIRLLRLDKVRLRLSLGRGRSHVTGGASLAAWTTARPLVAAHAAGQRKYEGAFDYETDDLWVLPGLELIGDLPAEASGALSRVVLGSVAEWERRHVAKRTGTQEPSTWRTSVFSRSDDQPHRFPVPSPLALALQTLPWLKDGDRAAAPGDWWLLPTAWADGPSRHRYAYLHPAPDVPRTDRGDRALRALGMPAFLPGTDGSVDAAVFLDAVAEGAAAGAASPSDLRSHSRQGWQEMEPDAEAWPQRLVVEVADAVEAWTPTDEHPCDLPPSSMPHVDALRAHGHPLVVMDPADASRLAEAMGEAYGPGVRRADALRAVSLVGGAEWTGQGALLHASPLAWTLDAVLAAHAFAGARTYRTDTDAFALALAALRSARVEVVADLATQLDLGSTRTAPQPTRAWWDDPSRTLLVRRDASMRDLARPLGRVVARRDLAFPLESAFSTLDVSRVSPSDVPTPPQLDGVYAALGVDVDRRRAVEHSTMEESAFLLQQALPILVLAGADLETLEGRPVLDLLARFPLDGASPEALLALCRESRSDLDLGRRLYDLAGTPLSSWNAALGRVDRPPVANTHGPAAAAHTLAGLRPLARAALRDHAVRTSEPAVYAQGARAVHAAAVDNDAARLFWDVPFALAMRPLLNALADVAPDVAALLSSATSVQDLQEQLNALGSDPADPETVSQENHRVAREATDALAQLWSAYRDAHSLPRPPLNRLETALDAALSAAGFVAPWTLTGARMAVAGHAAELHPGDTVLDAARSDIDAPALLAHLALAPDDLAAAQRAIDDRLLAEQRSQRTVDVAGTPFYAERLGDLWRHLDTHVAALPTVDLATLDAMADAPVRTGGGGGKGGGGLPRRAPQWKRDLTGLAGEIIAYRALQATYGDAAVSPTSWKSGNRGYAHGRRSPDPSADDGIGYDFEFLVDGVAHQVEVKASEGDRMAFEMGESEVRAAQAAARDASVRYLILRVSEALSATPRVRVLPNPFATEHEALFDVKGRGAVIYFHLADAT